MKLKRVSGMLGALSTLCIGAVAAGLVAHSAAANAETTLQRIQRTGELRIGYANESPFAYTTPDGTVTGESPEIAKKVFAKLGVNKVDAVLTEWGSLIPGLRAGRFDVIAAGMYVTPERCKQVAFANPQYQIQDTLLTLKGNPKNLQSYADVAKNPDAKLAVMAGSVELGYARDSGVKDGQLLQVPDTTAQLQAVRASRGRCRRNRADHEGTRRQGGTDSRSHPQVYRRSEAHRLRRAGVSPRRHGPARRRQPATESVARYAGSSQDGRPVWLR